VIATCGSEDKVRMLHALGVDRVVNYKKENLKHVLRTEYPAGIDLVYESVGGDMFQTAVNALAKKGRCIVIGMMSTYKSEWPPSQNAGLPEKLLWKSATLAGFFLPEYAHLYKPHLQRLTRLLEDGQLVVQLDPKQFLGLESVPDAVEHLQSGASVGKVVVQVADATPCKL